MEIKEIFVVALKSLGCFFILISAIGILRLDDAIKRSHALTKAMTLGICLFLIAYGLEVDSFNAKLKIGFILIFQFLTVSVASHLFVWYAVQNENFSFDSLSLLEKEIESDNKTP